MKIIFAFQLDWVEWEHFCGCISSSRSVCLGRRDTRTNRTKVCQFFFSPFIAAHDQALYGGWNANCDKYRLLTMAVVGKSFYIVIRVLWFSFHFVQEKNCFVLVMLLSAAMMCQHQSFWSVFVHIFFHVFCNTSAFAELQAQR